MRGAWFTCGLAGLAVALGGCPGPSVRYVRTQRLEVKEAQTKEGTKMVVEKKEELAEENVIEQSTNVKTVTKITGFDAKDKEKKTIGSIDVSPDGQRVVLSVVEEKTGVFYSQLWSTGRNGGAMTKVTSGQYKDTDPSCSPDGTYIYFATNRGDERAKLWRIQSDGLGGLTKITGGSTLDRMPSASPSGEQVVYMSRMASEGDWQLWRVTSSGALPTQMTLGLTPVYSPDGKKIAFCRANETTKKHDLWVMDADGSNQTQLTQGDHDNLGPRWDPTGTFLLFYSDASKDEKEKNNFDVYVMNIDGTGRTQLTTNGSWDGFPVFDPKGEFVYFVSNRGGAWNIWRMELSFKLK